MVLGEFQDILEQVDGGRPNGTAAPRGAENGYQPGPRSSTGPGSSCEQRRPIPACSRTACWETRPRHPPREHRGWRRRELRRFLCACEMGERGLSCRQTGAKTLLNITVPHSFLRTALENGFHVPHSNRSRSDSHPCCCCYRSTDCGKKSQFF